jgi:hypothetical protein
MEWTDSFYGGIYLSGRVLRGGSWGDGAYYLPGWDRYSYGLDPTGRYYGGGVSGFRCARTD